MKNVGVLTSGGDAPGMNAAIRAVVRTGLYYGVEMFGVRKGFDGLINGDFLPMDSFSVSNIIQGGGTILKTSRSEEFKTTGGMEKAKAKTLDWGIEAFVMLGG